MKIQIVSFLNKLAQTERIALTADVINNSKADLILFSGHTLYTVGDLSTLRKLITNKRSSAIIECEWLMNSQWIFNCLYQLRNGRIENMFTNQLFSTSHEIEGDHELASRLIHELETKRQITVRGKRALILQCGELNILRNRQSQANKVEFRVPSKELEKRFATLIHNTDIVLNPIHTPMGNQGKMIKRRQYLSANNRYYFSTSKTYSKKSRELCLPGLQYAFKNGKPLVELDGVVTDKYVVSTFNID